VIFVLLGGIPALLGYLWHRRWPVLEPCPACGQVVPRDREQCARCGVEFPVPKRHGIEVFAA
jgi:predicted amidophosphoribosyltransferase